MNLRALELKAAMESIKAQKAIRAKILEDIVNKYLGEVFSTRTKCALEDDLKEALSAFNNTSEIELSVEMNDIGRLLVECENEFTTNLINSIYANTEHEEITLEE